MKRIKYRVLGYMDSYNPDTEETEQVEALSHVDIPYSADNLAIAQRDAYSGEYTIEDDGQPETFAPRNIVAGEYITIDGVLYKATTNIPSGEPIIVGQNAVVTTVEEQLYELTKGD